MRVFYIAKVDIKFTFEEYRVKQILKVDEVSKLKCNYWKLSPFMNKTLLKISTAPLKIFWPVLL